MEHGILDHSTNLEELVFLSNIYDLYPFWEEVEQVLNEEDNSSKDSVQKKDKAFKCEFCPRSFTRKYDLARHVRIHTGVKPYECPACQKTFARSDGRRRHFYSNPRCLHDMRVQNLIHSKKIQ